MATVKQLKAREEELAAEFTQIMRESGYKAAQAKAAERWHFDALQKAREYHFRAPTVRHEFGNEEARNEIVFKADYEPHQQDADKDWTQLDEDNKAFFVEWHLPLTYEACVTAGDKTSTIALYLEARDMAL